MIFYSSILFILNAEKAMKLIGHEQLCWYQMLFIKDYKMIYIYIYIDNFFENSVNELYTHYIVNLEFKV